MMGYGYTSRRSYSVSYGVPSCVDSEVSPPYPESGVTGLSCQTFSESNAGFARLRDRSVKHPSGSHSYGDNYPAKVCGQRGGGTDKRANREHAEEKVLMAGESVLEREHCLVTGLLCIDGWS